MYTLYGDLRSGSTAVEFALAELGVAYEFQTVSLAADAQRDPAFRAVNPQGKVPALAGPGGLLLTESLAILLWLIENHDDGTLLPAPGSAERARALRWLVFIAADIYPLVEINDYPERFAGPDHAAALRERVRAAWRERWLLVEQAVAGPWLLGERFSVTDLYAAVVSRWAGQDDWRPAHLPRVEALFAEVADRPACRAVFRRNYPG